RASERSRRPVERPARSTCRPPAAAAPASAHGRTRRARRAHVVARTRSTDRGLRSWLGACLARARRWRMAQSKSSAASKLENTVPKTISGLHRRVALPPILEHPHPALSRPSVEVDPTDPEIVAIADLLVAIMR